MTKTNSHASQSKFSWLAYGLLSLSMLVIAAVSATVGQDDQQVVAEPKMGAEATTGSSAFHNVGLGMEETELKQDRKEIESYLERRFIWSLNPEMLSRRAMPAPQYQYAVKTHIDDKKIGNLVRFEITRTSNERYQVQSATPNIAAAPPATVVATGILQVDSAKIYMETPSSNGLVTLQPLNRNHLATIRNFRIESSADATKTQIARSSKR